MFYSEIMVHIIRLGDKNLILITVRHGNHMLSLVFMLQRSLINSYNFVLIIEMQC